MTTEVEVREARPQLEAVYLERAAEVLKAVAHPVRLQIIDALEDGPRTVSDLCRILGTAQPYMSLQLNQMKSRGILGSRREGNQVYYSIVNPSVVKVIHCIRQGAQAEGQGQSVDGPAGGSRVNELVRDLV